MTFQIVRISPTYCSITDAQIGSSAHPLPMSYQFEDLAHRIAGRMTDRAYEGCSDDHFVVVAYGESAFTARRQFVTIIDTAFDDMPF